MTTNRFRQLWCLQNENKRQPCRFLWVGTFCKYNHQPFRNLFSIGRLQNAFTIKKCTSTKFPYCFRRPPPFVVNSRKAILFQKLMTFTGFFVRSWFPLWRAFHRKNSFFSFVQIRIFRIGQAVFGHFGAAVGLEFFDLSLGPQQTDALILESIGDLFTQDKNILLFSGCGSVGRAVASDTRGPRFESVIDKIYIESLFTCFLSTVLKRRK